MCIRDSHWVERDRKRYIAKGHLASTMAQASSTMFLRNVSTLVSTTKSPKHPQSFTGLATNIHSVTMVITDMSAKANLETKRRRIANKMCIRDRP